MGCRTIDTVNQGNWCLSTICQSLIQELQSLMGSQPQKKPTPFLMAEWSEQCGELEIWNT